MQEDNGSCMNTNSAFPLHLYLGLVSSFCIKFIIALFNDFTVKLGV